MHSINPTCNLEIVNESLFYPRHSSSNYILNKILFQFAGNKGLTLRNIFCLYLEEMETLQ